MQTKISIKFIIQSLQKQLENTKFFLKLIKGIYKNLLLMMKEWLLMPKINNKIRISAVVACIQHCSGWSNHYSKVRDTHIINE